MAELGQDLAQSPHPTHLANSICPVSLSVAPVGQTYRHMQSLVHILRFLEATILGIAPPPRP